MPRPRHWNPQLLWSWLGWKICGHSSAWMITVAVGLSQDEVVLDRLVTTTPHLVRIVKQYLTGFHQSPGSSLRHEHYQLSVEAAVRCSTNAMKLRTFIELHCSAATHSQRNHHWKAWFHPLLCQNMQMITYYNLQWRDKSALKNLFMRDYFPHQSCLSVTPRRNASWKHSQTGSRKPNSAYVTRLLNYAKSGNYLVLGKFLVI